jgi:ABC-type antimicrobial peptide transport system permease subunit
MGMITLESVLMCLLGAAIGLGLGLASVASLADGFIFPGQEETFEQLGMNPVLYPSVEPWQVLVAVGFALTTAILASLWPASIAARTEPAEAMRYVA